MGANSVKSLWKKLYGEKDVKILMFGFNVESVQYKHINITSWDVGGRDKIRPLWRHYYRNTNAMIFVVDSNDRDRVSYSKDELHKTLEEEELRDIPVLVLANKQDLPNAMSVGEITDKLELHSIQSHNWYIQSACATTGDGLYEGLDWLHSEVTRKAVKESVTKPLQETKESVTKSEGLWSSIYSTLNNFYSPTAQ